jgi:transposase
LANEIRGLLLEYGIVISRGIWHIRKDLTKIVGEHGNRHSETWLSIFHELYEEFCELDRRVAEYDRRLAAIAQSDERCKRLLKIPGVGNLGATAIVAAVGNAKEFTNGRQFAAWLGLTPKQYSTGGKSPGQSHWE